MIDERAKRVAELFQQALGLPDDQRADFLDQQCGSDQGLRERLETLLRHDGAAETGFLAGRGEGAATDTLLPLEGPGASIGPYKLRTRIGAGGFGEVYLAEQTEPVRRNVALKLIKPGMDTRQVIARFEAERQALAMMDHPNIAKVFEAGATQRGRPYFVMEHVPGVPITEYCDAERLDTGERLHLLIQVCDAVQHAHQKGIIHRDLKPSNLLVELVDARPIPKIIDFGIAKATGPTLTERTLFTEPGQLIGTPEYMSPEQAEMSGIGVDSRTDIYSLGVVLYELLTGLPPFDPQTLRGKGVGEIRRIIREVDPPAPSTRVSTFRPRQPESEPEAQAPGPSRSVEGPLAGARAPEQPSVQDIARNRRTDPRTLRRALKDDLDWITMKAMEKERARRYASASEFAADLRHHLNHQPVLAGPPSAAYRMSKFVRRHRTGVAAAVVIALVLLSATGVSIGFALSEADQRRIAEHATGRAQENLALAEQRADEATEARDNLQTVVDFQSSLLGDIDAELMGLGIFADLRDGIRESLAAEGATPEEIGAAITSFNASLNRVNATDLALEVVDEHVLVRAVETIEQDFADQPVVEAALRQTVGNTYLELGLYPQAMPQMERALALRREVLGDDDPETLKSIDNMGGLFLQMGRLAEAEPYGREALDGMRRVLGDDHPDTLASINNMGGLLKLMGKLTEAEPYHREALEGRRRVLGDDHSETLESLNNMGGLLHAMGELQRAEPYYRDALLHNRRVLGNDHRHTLASISNMGALLHSMGKLDEAETYHREALEGSRRVLGDDHPNTLGSIVNMGYLLQSMGRLREAQPYLREALEGCRRVLGDDHPNTLITINQMALLLDSMGNVTEAESYYLEALAGSRRVQGDDHPNTLVMIANVGSLLRAMGRLQEAEPYAREALAGCRRVLGDDHPHTLTSMYHLAVLLGAMGKHQEAEPLFAAAVEGARRSMPEGHWQTGKHLAGYGKCLTKLNRYADAESALLEAHRVYESAFGAEDKRTASSIQSLIDLYDAWDEAEPDEGYEAKAAQWRAKL